VDGWKINREIGGGSASGGGGGSGSGSGGGSGDLLSADAMVLVSQLLDLNAHYWTLLAWGPPALFS
jgi:hypothetical protein